MSSLSRENSPLFSRFNQLIADQFRPIERPARWATRSGLLAEGEPGFDFPGASAAGPDLREKPGTALNLFRRCTALKS